jgi:RNA polymerase sigma-70 factor (ECF subfamily)
MTNDDFQLIKRAQDGDTDAIAVLFDQYYPNVFRYVLSRVGDPTLSEDISGETFLRLVERIDDLTDQGRPLLAWLFTVARNLVNDHHRQHRGVVRVCLRETLIAGTPSPETTVERHLTEEQVVAALDQIADAQRHVIVLRFIEGLELKSVAQIVHKSVNAVKSLQHRGLAALRRVLEIETV